MKKYINKLKPVSLFIFGLSLLIFPIKIHALDDNGSLGYTINSYNINIIVNENNTLNITEKINVYFYTDKHGIIRKIPLKNKIIRLDGTTSKNRANISDVKVNDKYKLSTSNGYKAIKIGDANKTIRGQKNYEISYLYNLGRDTGKGYDELYFNLIGDEWDTSISNITFTIKMPKAFNSSKLGFSSGAVGSTDSSKITYSINGNTIRGSYDGTLNEGEALTVRLELPEGYFVGTSLNVDFLPTLTLTIPILFVLIAYLLWSKYRNNEQIIETVEFYPPQGFNSLEIGFLYKGSANNKDVTSLIIYLANKGYIKISEVESSSSPTEKSFKLTKLKEYDGNNINEKIFLNGLFTKAIESTPGNNNGIVIENVNEVTSEDLKDNFYITMEKILQNMNSKENRNLIFKKSALNKAKILKFMCIAIYYLITIPPLLENYNALILLMFVVPTLILYFSLNMVEGLAMASNNRKYNNMSILILIEIIMGCVPCTGSIIPSLLENTLYLIENIVGFICIYIIIMYLKNFQFRTQYGVEMLGKLLGYKDFLEIVEQEKLEAMVMQNPTYFYDILPYTYVLEVSDKWIEKFESISLQTPSWYESSADFDIKTFGEFMDTTMISAQKSMSSSPYGDSDGYDGGGSSGGSSGGGSGGGGGSSW